VTQVFSAKSAQKKLPLENKFSRHFFFAYSRKKECGCPYGPSEKIKNRVDNRGSTELPEIWSLVFSLWKKD
jgi:hypothetical protein